MRTLYRRTIASAAVLVLALTGLVVASSPAGAAPALSSIAPVGVFNTSANNQLTINGTGFVEPVLVELVHLNELSEELYVFEVPVTSVTSTQIKAALDARGEEPGTTGSYEVRVTNLTDETSDQGLSFSIFAAGLPTIEPNKLNIQSGQTRTFEIEGTNFTKTMEVDIADSANPIFGVAVDDYTWISLNRARITLTAASQAHQPPNGPRTLELNTYFEYNPSHPDSAGGETTCDECVVVSDGLDVPEPTGASPTVVGNTSEGTTTIRVDGEVTSFPTDAESPVVRFFGPDGRVLEMSDPEFGQTLNPPGGPRDELEGEVGLFLAAPGPYDVEVTGTGFGVGFAEGVFTVITAGAPEISSPSPGSPQELEANTDNEITVLGANFAHGIEVTTNHPGIKVLDGPDVSDLDEFSVTLEPDSSVENGLYDLTVTNTDGQTATCSNCLEVTNGLPPAEPYQPVALTRLGDTRKDGSKVPTNLTVYTVGGSHGVPGDAAAVVVNLTITQPTGAGHATAYPCAQGRPNASNVNFKTGQTIAGAAIVQPDALGRICLFTNPKAHHVVDLAGYYPGSARFRAFRAVRTLDTRSTSPLAAGGTLEIDVDDLTAVHEGAKAAALTVTAVRPMASGHLRVFPCGTPRPTTSNVNFGAGDVIANLVVAELGTDGKVCIYSSTTTDVVVDTAGSWPSHGYLIADGPIRVIDTRTGGGARIPANSTFSVPMSGVPASAQAVLLNVTVTQSAGSSFLSAFPCGTSPPSSNLNFVSGQTIANAVIVPMGTFDAVCFRSPVSVHLIVDRAGYLPDVPDV